MLAPAPALCQSARPVGCDPRAADGYHCRSEEEPRGPGGCPGTRREVLSSRRIGVVGCRPAGEGGPCPMAARTGDTRVPWNRGEASDHGEPGHRRGTRLLRTRPSGHSRGARLTTGWAAHADELETSIHLFLRPDGVHRDLVQAGNDMVPFDFRWQDVEPGGMVGLAHRSLRRPDPRGCREGRGALHSDGRGSRFVGQGVQGTADALERGPSLAQPRPAHGRAGGLET